MVVHHQQKQDYKQGITVIVRFKDLENKLKLAGNFKMKGHSFFWQTFLQLNCSENLHGFKRY